MNNKKAAIFDLDGTLIDSMYVWSKIDEDFLTDRGIEPTAEYSEKMRGMYFQNAAEYTKNTYGLDESVEEIVKIWLDMARYEYEHNVPLKKYAAEYLGLLREKGIRIGMATSSMPYLLEPVLKRNGIDQYFDEICYTHTVGKTKDNPDIYLYTAERLGVTPDRCVVYEDIPEGIGGANKAGMFTVAVFDSANIDKIDELRSSADLYIDSFDEIMHKELWK